MIILTFLCINAILCCIECVCILLCVLICVLPYSILLVIFGLICPIIPLYLLLVALGSIPIPMIIFTILAILSILFPALWITACFYIFYMWVFTPIVYLFPLCIWMIICISLCFFPISLPCYLCLCCCILATSPISFPIVCCIFCVLLTLICYAVFCSIPSLALLVIIGGIFGCIIGTIISIPCIFIFLLTVLSPSIPTVISIITGLGSLYELIVRLFELIMPSIMPFIMRLYNLLMQNPLISQLASALYPMLGSLSSMLSALLDALGFSGSSFSSGKNYGGSDSSKTAVKDIINLYPASFDGVVR